MAQTVHPPRWLATTAALLISFSFTYAQTQGGGTTGGSSGTSTGTSKGGATSTGSKTGSKTDPDPVGTIEPHRTPQMLRPACLQGNVVFSDGTPASNGVTVGCGRGGRMIGVQTGTKGRFSITVLRNAQLTNGPTYGPMGGRAKRSSGNRGGAYMGHSSSLTVTSAGMLMGCVLQANLAGYRSSKIDLSGHWIDDPDIGTLILTPLAKVEGLTISATSLLAPKKAQKALENGKKEFENQNWESAQKQFEKAVGLHENYAEAWFELGRLQEALDQPAAAREAYAKSVAADEHYIGPYVRLALLDLGQGRWDEAAAHTRLVLKLNPYDFPEVYYYDSVANLKLGESAAAEKSARETIKLDEHRRFPQVEHILGMSLAYQNNYAEAAVHLRKYLELLPQAPNSEQVKEHLAQVESASLTAQPVARQP